VERLAPVIQGTTVELIHQPEDGEALGLSPPPLSLLGCADVTE
jgi:hypothetical protein